MRDRQKRRTSGVAARVPRVPIAIFTAGLVLVVGVVWILPALPSVASGARLGQALLAVGLLVSGGIGLAGLILLHAIARDSRSSLDSRTWVALGFGFAALLTGGALVGNAAAGNPYGTATPLSAMLLVTLPVARTLYRLGHRYVAILAGVSGPASILVPIAIYHQ